MTGNFRSKPLAFAAPAAALVRTVPASYADCLRSEPVSIDPEKARAQAQNYARLLAACGVQVITLPGDEACPDACFIEDTAVVLNNELALITHMGAPSRWPESPPVIAALKAQGLHLLVLSAPASLDGGDVMRAGKTLFVGLSGRTNAAGAEVLAKTAGPLGMKVVTLPVAQGLHLKSLITLVRPDLAVVLKDSMPLDALAAAGLSWIETDEPAGANVLALGQRVIVSAAAHQTHARLARESGLELHSIDVSELHKGDGALTCLSLRIPPSGAWCA
ncbi:MAG: dimethylarginine dimethylaminohydrolase family protein [Candidatus Sericytochromatia bacterium]